MDKHSDKSIEEQAAFAKVLLHYGLVYDVSTDTQKIICPFHADVNASMKINFNACNWFCFGCHKKGDGLTIIRLMEPKLNELQACKRYMQIQRSDKLSDVVKTRIISKRYAVKSKTDKQLYNEAYDFYYGLKKVNWYDPDIDEAKEALTYLSKRGITKDALIKVQAKITYQKSYSIIFPMLDNGKFKGWVSRTMLPDLEKKRKYLYNKGFSRATTLVGDYADIGDTVFVVEGYIDRLKFIQFGENRVVALLGWKATQQQIEKLKQQGIENIISALDNDACGKAGTKYLKSFFNVFRWRYIKSVKDPGDMTQQSFHLMYRRTMSAFDKRKVKDSESWD